MRVHIRAPGGDPRALVEYAAEMAAQADEQARRTGDDNLRYDEIWCVLDVDEHARLEEARRIGSEAGVKLAVSNPCFELWLLLHYSEQNGHVERKPVAKLLQHHLPNYDKHVDFQSLYRGYTDAVARAASLDRRHAQASTEGGNPSTGVYRLTERIRELGRSRRL